MPVPAEEDEDSTGGISVVRLLLFPDSSVKRHSSEIFFFHFHLLTMNRRDFIMKLLISCDLLCSLLGNMRCDLYLYSVVFRDIDENVPRGTTAEPRIPKLR